ncbi:16S rRNA (guanine(527)-N(7))-methyltransferase RsmG [Pseudohoeflea coraliihabitans]|uniref:Ribosomal RNA small subunit methyltransferase G n=1 Tax=Pseudohoeflea coraliihabitans TaxID=2860393 RepID=A0ABS6WT61_9HYPH|nr:16S rRNA (guanine(527)-N(7))-methyltransferase RsmG [Pseudohoeflea sp. DP4N28-3]MBW3099143.1 16S rRNA (guanine(527)-N(7))-methyltransferase RsmG [Pseudohoeflea sp. DP4N28-3]
MRNAGQRSADSSFVSRETLERLDIYAELLKKWQASINLVSADTLDQLWERHFKDSLQLAKLCPQPLNWIDMGSGAGFPGLPMAICLTEFDQGWVHLIESNNKKAAFLRAVIAATGARASVHAQRIEEAVSQLDAPDAISARALAPLPNLCALAAPFAARRADLSCWFHKGLGYPQEVEAARRFWEFDLVEHPSTVRDGAAILEITQLAPRQ